MHIEKGVITNKETDLYRVNTDEIGRITFRPIKMSTIVFAKILNEDGVSSDKTYMFKNPNKKRIKRGQVIKVNTCGGVKYAWVVSSIKIFDKYLKDLFIGIYGIEQYNKTLQNKKLRIENVVCDEG